MKPSDWIILRAKEKAKNERDGEIDLINAGILKKHRFLTDEDHVFNRFPWFIPESTLEYLDKTWEGQPNNERP